MNKNYQIINKFNKIKNKMNSNKNRNKFNKINSLKLKIYLKRKTKLLYFQEETAIQLWMDII